MPILLSMFRFGDGTCPLFVAVARIEVIEPDTKPGTALIRYDDGSGSDDCSLALGYASFAALRKAGLPVPV